MNWLDDIAPAPKAWREQLADAAAAPSKEAAAEGLVTTLEQVFQQDPDLVQQHHLDRVIAAAKAAGWTFSLTAGGLVRRPKG